MKKILKMFLALCVCFVLATSFLPKINFGSASADSLSASEVYNIKTTINKVLSEFVEYDERIAGTSGEVDASEYIINYLNNLGRLEAYESENVSGGIQTFKFESNLTGKFETSQNIIYLLNSTKENVTKKIIIGCSYDAMSLSVSEYSTLVVSGSQGVNQSAGAVAVMLALAEYLPTDLDYNIEFVFFGAGQNYYAGSSEFVKGISDEEKENILLMINLDNIAFGSSLYFYVDEFDNDLSDSLTELANSQSISISKVNTANLLAVSLTEANDLGLSYTHIAMQSNNYNFMKSGIMTVSVFAGDYSSGIIIGRSEFIGEDVLTYTENETLEYYAELYGETAITTNLYSVFEFVETSLTDLDLQSIVSSTQSQKSVFYAIFANEKLVFYLCVVAFVLFVIVALFIYYKLSIKAYNANVEEEFIKSVITISENVSNEPNADMPKVISEVVANDIKKDKIIKGKKKK